MKVKEYTLIKKYGIHFILFLIFFIIFQESVFTSSASDVDNKRVLFISSYSENFETVPLQIDGIRSELLAETVYLDIEYMDTKRFNTLENIANFKQMLTYKLKNLPPYDAIMVGDDAALLFAIDNQDELFFNIPIVFLCVNDYERAIIAGADDFITGVIEESSLKENIEIALTFQPEAKRILAIVDDTLTGIGDKQQFYANQQYFPDMKFEHINSSIYTYEEVAAMVREVADDTILFYLSMNEDKFNNFITMEDGIQLIVENAKVPIYRQSIGGVGQGILGGKMVSYIESGRLAGEMVQKILNGTPLNEIEVITKSPTVYFFDYKIIKKYNINMELVPKEAILLNQSLSFFERHKTSMLIILGVIAFFSFIVTLLCLDIFRRRKFTRVLKENNERLTATYEELAATEEELRNQYMTIQEYSHEIEFQAKHDYLTKLPNRRSFTKKLKNEIKNNNPCTILLMDIDNFKKINDILGHVYGDILLKEIADRFLTIQDDNIYFSRFGGDEFFILIQEVEREKIEYYLKEISNIFEDPFLMDLKENYIQFSIGVARFPYDAVDANDLIVCADTAMYQAKSFGKNNYLFYENEMQKQLRKRLQIEEILRNAIQNDGFYLLYQPQVSVKTGEVNSFEALLRIKDQPIPPVLFIEVAEETNLILEVGRIVTKKAIAQLARWREQGLVQKPISINFSSKQVRDKTYIEYLEHMLKQFEILPQLLEIEITESIFLENSSVILEFLNQLRSIGVQLALDDFGTGFASINYLTYIPVSKIKLDKSLADKFLKLDSNKTMESIILLAHSLNLEITAEGIEEIDQYRRLNELGCDYIQGYLFSKPLCSEDVLRVYNLNLLVALQNYENDNV